MNDQQLIVVGAGAAGLFASLELANAGFKVLILEGRNRTGGRVLTIPDRLFPSPVEMGAEFVHGDLEITKSLAKKAGAKLQVAGGDLWRLDRGKFVAQDDFIEDVDEVIKRLKSLQSDISVDDFLDTYFGGERHLKLRRSLKGFVEGYDAADGKTASSFALLQELLAQDEDQYRVDGGYKCIVDFLVSECKKAGCELRLETTVKQIHWSKNKVEALDQNGKKYLASKIIITIPLGVLQTQAALGSISFQPLIPEIKAALNSLGYGTVIKTILNFEEPVWKNAPNQNGVARSSPGFIFSEAIIPTWWTQMPEKNGMITGWIAGPKATRIEDQSEDNVFHLALESLAVIFQIPRKTLESNLKGAHTYNWSTDEYALGAYGFETVKAKHAKELINEGVANTVFFAGEAYHQGPERGTVEAALASGLQIAKKIIATKVGTSR